MDRSVKLLLTLLALLTGLSAAPAQARPCAGSGIEQVQPPGASCAASVAAANLSGRVAKPARAEPAVATLRTPPGPRTPPVRQGDRALE